MREKRLLYQFYMVMTTVIQQSAAKGLSIPRSVVSVRTKSRAQLLWAGCLKVKRLEPSEDTGLDSKMQAPWFKGSMGGGVSGSSKGKAITTFSEQWMLEPDVRTSDFGFLHLKSENVNSI